MSYARHTHHSRPPPLLSISLDAAWSLTASSAKRSAFSPALSHVHTAQRRVQGAAHRGRQRRCSPSSAPLRLGVAVQGRAQAVVDGALHHKEAATTVQIGKGVGRGGRGRRDSSR